MTKTVTGRTSGNGRKSRAAKAIDLLSRREPLAAVLNYTTGPTTAGALVTLTQVAQGTGLNTRSGDKIFVECVNVSCTILATATSNWRYIVVRDRFNTGSAPSVIDIITNAAVSAPLSSINVVQQKRFTILLDKTLSFSTAGQLSHTFRHKLSVNQPTYYTGSTALANPSSGQIYLLLISDVATPGTHDFNAQLVYSDF